MYTCVTYDISSNRLRLRVSKWCKKAGLLRMQKSVFIGRATQERMTELEKDVRDELADNDKFAIISLDKTAFCALLNQLKDPRMHAINKAASFWNF